MGSAIDPDDDEFLLDIIAAQKTSSYSYEYRTLLPARLYILFWAPVQPYSYEYINLVPGTVPAYYSSSRPRSGNKLVTNAIFLPNSCRQIRSKIDVSVQEGYYVPSHLARPTAASGVSGRLYQHHFPIRGNATIFTPLAHWRKGFAALMRMPRCVPGLRTPAARGVAKQAVLPGSDGMLLVYRNRKFQPVCREPTALQLYQLRIIGSSNFRGRRTIKASRLRGEADRN